MAWISSLIQSLPLRVLLRVFLSFGSWNHVCASSIAPKCRDRAESIINDVFAGVVEDLYQRTDSEAKGYVNWKMFSHLLKSAEMSPFLLEQDNRDIQDRFKSSVPSGKASYEQFCVLAKDLILRVYRAKDPSDVSV